MRLEAVGQARGVRLHTVQVAGLAAAVLAYGIANAFSGLMRLPGSSFVELRPQVALPMVMGFVYGPMAGLLTGCLGDSLGYVIQGLGPLHAWNWSLGNGLIGAIPGIGPLLGMRGVRSIRDFQRLTVLVVAASFVPIAFAAAIDTLRPEVNLVDSIYTLVLPAAITDAVFGMLFVPAALLGMRRVVVTVETQTMLLLAYLLLGTVLVTYGASTWRQWLDPSAAGLIIRDLYMVGLLCLLVLLLGLFGAAYLARRVTAPVVGLAEAAAAIAKGDYAERPDVARVALREDELGRLAAVFLAMSRDVAAREARLQTQVQALSIEIDRVRQDQDVARITGTDYFQELRRKVKDLRDKR